MFVFHVCCDCIVFFRDGVEQGQSDVQTNRIQWIHQVGMFKTKSLCMTSKLVIALVS